jgi:transcription elongation factor Elf1
MPATATLPTNTAEHQTRGFSGLPCPKCGQNSQSIRVDLDDTSTFTCTSCDESFPADEVEEMIAKWQAVIAWVRLAPIAE